jgi:hypothetical protein
MDRNVSPDRHLLEEQLANRAQNKDGTVPTANLGPVFMEPGGYLYTPSHKILYFTQDVG